MKLALFLSAAVLSGPLLFQARAQTVPFTDPTVDISTTDGSTYIPMDSWVYPAMDRLHALGYVDSAYLGIRPWTRLSVQHMLAETAPQLETRPAGDEAQDLYYAILHEVEPAPGEDAGPHHRSAQLESVYTSLRGIGGTPLRDSFHLGQTIVNDYGRPYEEGFNNYSGFSARGRLGRFALYYRGEYQHAPSADGYSPALADYLSETIDLIPAASNPRQDTIPMGPIASTNQFRVLEATLSYHLLGHEISFGKSDHWLGPGQGGSMLWSNNADNIYQFQIDRTAPLRIPLLSRLIGPVRYDFFVGSLQGHTYPNSPWVHMEKLSFKPTRNLEIGFDRIAVWGGKDHAPITLHTFLKSFFSFQNVTVAEKQSRNDPGYRLSGFDFNYRLPYLRNWVTLYTDSLVHDDVSPIDAPRRAALRPGMYLARFPGAPHLDLRVEGASTDPGAIGARAGAGQFFYYENVQRQGPTNKGFLLGDWVGREGKGGQAWLTYHLSPREDIQLMYRNAKAAVQFLPGGTTQNDIQAEVRKRVGRDIEVQGWLQYERWKAPVYKIGAQSDTAVSAQITWFPHDKTK